MNLSPDLTLCEGFPLQCLSAFPLRLKDFQLRAVKADELPILPKKFSSCAAYPSKCVSIISPISAFETKETPMQVTDVLAGVKDVDTASSLPSLITGPNTAAPTSTP